MTKLKKEKENPLTSDKSKAVITKFKQVRLAQDIPKFLDEVEAEAIRILEANNLPTDNQQLTKEVIYETINNKTWIDAAKEAPGDFFEPRTPTSIYQAKRILTSVLAARWYVKQSEFHDELKLARDGLAFTVGEIVRVMYLSRLPVYIGLDAPRGKGNTGKKSTYSTLIEKAIEMTAKSKGHWIINGNDVLDTLSDDPEIQIDEFMNDSGNPAFRIIYRDDGDNIVREKKSLKTIENKISQIKE